MAIAEPIELFGVNRKDMKATFHQQLDDGTPWDFDGDRHTVHLPCGQGRQPCGALRQSDSLMLDAACSDTVAVPVQDTDLVRLRAPINPHKPLVGEGRLCVLMTMLYLIRRYHDCISSLFAYVPWSVFGPILALVARLPTRYAPRKPCWGTCPSQALRVQGIDGIPSKGTHYSTLTLPHSSSSMV